MVRELRLNKVPVKVGWAKTTNKLNRNNTEKYFAHQKRDKLVYPTFSFMPFTTRIFSAKLNIREFGIQNSEVGIKEFSRRE